MLLTFDIGNTNISVGLFDGAHLAREFRLRTDPTRPADEYAAQLLSLLNLGTGVGVEEILDVAIASVVPRVTQTFLQIAERYLLNAEEPFLVRAGETDTGLTIAYDPPNALGADRLVNAAGVHHLYARQDGKDGKPAACVVVDYGTATKLEAVTAEGEYRGGVILPGVGPSLDALYGRAALLRPVELSGEPPQSAIGTNTTDALRAGILYGFAAQTDGLVYRFIRELNAPDVRVVATGGYASIVAPYASTVEIVDSHLTLTGLRLLYERHATAKANRNDA